MKLAQIFEAVEETRLLKKLSSKEKLFFVGESAPLEYIKNFFNDLQPSNCHHFYDLTANRLDDLTQNITEIQRSQAIVVVSLEDETVLSVAVNQQLEQFNFSPPVLRLFSDIFVNLLSHRGLLSPLPEQTLKPRISYAILTTPRSGSTYLCDLLDSTNIAGHPSEHLRFAAQELSQYCNFDYLRLLDNVMTYRVTNNSVFGTKLISHFLFELRQTKPQFKRLFTSIDKFILLVREDKVAQAVSLVLAQKTAVWHLRGDSSKQVSYQSKLEDIEINRALLDEVEQKCNFINQQETRLKKILANNQVEPLTVVYEEIIDNPQLQINRILDFLAIDRLDPHTMQIHSQIKKMPSDISQEIIRQYQASKITVG